MVSTGVVGRRAREIEQVSAAAPIDHVADSLVILIRPREHARAGDGEAAGKVVKSRGRRISQDVQRNRRRRAREVVDINAADPITL